MAIRAYSMRRGMLDVLVLTSLALAAMACGDDDDGGRVDVGPGPKVDLDAGTEDAQVPPLVLNPPPPDRNVPMELKGHSCAVEVDKLYALGTVASQGEAVQLAVDVVQSRFAIGYIGKSETCNEALYLAQLQGANRVAPEIMPVLDPCSAIDHSAIAYGGEAWLVGSVDARMGPIDLWAQSYDPDRKQAGEAHRISDTPGRESEPVLAMSPSGQGLAAWVERDVRAGSAQLLVRSIAGDGDPQHEVVTLATLEDGSFASLTMSAIGPELIALGYRSFDMTGRSDIVLDVLDSATGERDREPWILTTLAGVAGSVDIDADLEGGGVVYSVIQEPSRQLWFQQLGVDGRAAPVGTARAGGAAGPLRIVGPPLRAIDASIAKIAAGFVLAYRSLPGGQVQAPRISIHFLDRFGRVIGDSGVALASQVGGRTAIETAYDGRIVLGWSDTSQTGVTTLTAARLPCVGD